MHQRVRQLERQHVRQPEHPHVQRRERQRVNPADHRQRNHLLSASKTAQQIRTVSQLECLNLHVSQPTILNRDLVQMVHRAIIAEGVLPEEVVVLAAVVLEEVGEEDVDK